METELEAFAIENRLAKSQALFNIIAPGSIIKMSEAALRSAFMSEGSEAVCLRGPKNLYIYYNQSTKVSIYHLHKISLIIFDFFSFFLSYLIRNRIDYSVKMVRFLFRPISLDKIQKYEYFCLIVDLTREILIRKTNIFSLNPVPSLWIESKGTKTFVRLLI